MPAPSLTRRSLLLGTAALGLAACTDATAPADGAVSPSSSPTVPAAAPTTTAAPAPTTTAAPAPTSTAPTSTVSAGGPAAFVRHGDRSRAEVALTFHTNGDPVLVSRLADALAAARLVGTMFVVGEWAATETALLRRLLADGHELANHTWSHRSLADLPRAEMDREIVRCSDVLATINGGPVRFFRPSAIEVPTDEILAAAGAAGYRVSLGYDVDPLDYTDPGAAAVLAGVADAVDRGSIVSLHTGHADTVAAIGGLASLLSARGLRPVTCSTLLR